MEFKVLRTKDGYKEFVIIDNNQKFTSLIPDLFNNLITINDLTNYYQNINWDIDLSDSELVDYVLIEKNNIYPTLLWLLKPVLNLISLLKLKENNDSFDKIKDDMINNEINNCELIFQQIKNIFIESNIENKCNLN